MVFECAHVIYASPHSIYDTTLFRSLERKDVIKIPAKFSRSVFREGLGVNPQP